VALTAFQIIDLAKQMAKTPAYDSQALALLNATLRELALEYDFDIIRKTQGPVNMSTTGVGLAYSYALGTGVDLVPSDYVRLCRNGSWYMISGVPYTMVGVEQEEFDRLVQQAGLNSFPTYFYIDTAQSTPVVYVWPPPSGSFQMFLRYRSMPADLPATVLNSTDTTVPWFPCEQYLITRAAGELMKISNDDRWSAMIGDTDEEKDNPGSACSILRRYLRMKDEPEIAAKKVELDRRRFRSRVNLPNTKQIGW
jgi:hypothetical protein